MPPILYLIDGHALAYRTYYAITAGMSDRMQTREGEPTAGIFGFANVLMRLLEQEKPEYLAVAFDTGKTFRNDLYQEYKATRAKMPDDLRPQIERIRKMIDTFHLPRLEKEGVEADDVLGSIARQAVEQGLGVKIITGDRDLLQLVDDRITVSLPGAKLSDSKNYAPADVREYLGVEPSQVVDYKALVGDTSDNIPGIPGIGPKTAVSLLEKFSTLDGVYEHIDEITGKTREKLETGKDSAYMSQDLARIRTDVGVKLVLDEARTDHINVPAVEALFRELEFRTLIPRLRMIVSPLTHQPTPQLSLFGEEVKEISIPSSYDLDVKVIDTPEKLQQLLKDLTASKLIAFDTETNALDPLRADLVGISLAVRESEGYYIPVGHRSGRQLPLAEVLAALKDPLTDPKIGKAGHNLKYDYLMLKRAGLVVSPLTFDTMIAEWLINPASRNLGLKNLAWVRLGYEMTHIEELIGKGSAQKTMDAVPISEAAGYAAADAAIVMRLIPQLKEELQTQAAESLFETMEMPLIPILAQMEETGILLDKDFFKRFSKELGERLAEIETQIYAAVGYQFNLNSTQQLSEALFEKLGLEPPDRTKKTSSGHYSTAAGVLEGMAGQHPVLDLVLEYRELEKLRSTYVDSLPSQINPETGRVHTSLNQTGTVTGRIASSDPNLQNIPTRTKTGQRVRNGFIAREGWQLLAVDYSQIELRIVAHMAQDQAMLAAFRAGQDIHATTAAAVHGIALDEVTPEMRRHAKAINFGLIYGMSAYGLTNATDLTLAEAENFIKAYFEEFPGVETFLDGIKKTAAEKGYVETLLGRRRYFPNLKKGAGYNVRQREEREAINAPIQGTAADIIKLAMLKLPSEVEKAGLQAKMLLQVHDELMFEVPDAELKETTALVQKVMEGAYHLDIPLSTEAKAGRSWGEMAKL